MFVLLYVTLAAYCCYCGVHYDRRNIKYRATTVGDVIIYFLMGLIPVANLMMACYETFFIIKNAEIFSRVLIESPQTLEAKKIRAEKKAVVKFTAKPESDWEEF